MRDSETVDRKLRNHIAAIILIRDLSYTCERACDLAEEIIKELKLHRENTPGFTVETWQGEKSVHKKCYRYATDWRTE